MYVLKFYVAFLLYNIKTSKNVKSSGGETRDVNANIKEKMAEREGNERRR